MRSLGQFVRSFVFDLSLELWRLQVEGCLNYEKHKRMIIKATFHPRSIENSQAKNDCNKAVPNVKHRLSYAAFSSIYIGSCWEDFMQQTFQLLKFLLCIHVVFNAKLFFSSFLDLGAFAVEVMLRCDDVLLRSE